MSKSTTSKPATPKTASTKKSATGAKLPTETGTASAKPKVKPIPDGMHTVTAHLIVAGAAEAIAFYKKAFNAIEGACLAGPDGKIMHAMIRIGDSPVFLVDEHPSYNALGPKARNGTSVTLHLSVADADATAAQAVAAGAKVVFPVADMFWGDRYGIVEDPFGHRWSLATHIRDMTPDEIKAAVPKALDS